jgi:hypothetical protein
MGHLACVLWPSGLGAKKNAIEAMFSRYEPTLPFRQGHEIHFPLHDMNFSSSLLTPL